MSKIFKLFLSWRALLFLPLIVAPMFIKERVGYEYSHTMSVLFSAWANFDGVHYLSIAANGYSVQAAFFPLYPLLIKAFSFGHSVFLPGLILSNIAFFGSLIILYKLLRLDYGEGMSYNVLLILLLFPTSFFFGAVYSESLFFLLLIASLYFARKGKWFWASTLAMLLTATRIVGIFIFPALIYEFCVQKKPLKEAISLALVPAGLVFYSVYNFIKWKDWLYFVHVHSELGNGRDTNGIILFPQTVYRYIKIFLSLSPSQYEWWIAVLEISIFFVISFLLYYAWKKKVRASDLIFSILAFLLPSSSGTFSGLPRYVIILFPIYIAVSCLGSGPKKAFIFFSTILLVILLMFFSRGYYVA